MLSSIDIGKRRINIGMREKSDTVRQILGGFEQIVGFEKENK